MFEANSRLLKHPYDIIGVRRLKLFEDYLKAENICENRNTPVNILKMRMAQYWDIYHESVQNQVFVVVKIVTTFAAITLIVNVNDFMQDLFVIRTFWTIGYMGHVLDQ